ncbi:hypothetical protein [Tolypothrix sp. VBCCA 56010]|uniref:hypothetical protein n=1 Tax=Tolypothrix sp. VBCCA 56010 TaxID=3137731 RepID=UPI003D7E12C4
MLKQLILAIALSSFIYPTSQVHAQNSSCANFWLNPKTGQEECFTGTPGSVNQDRTVRGITGRTEQFSISSSPLTIVDKVIVPCQKNCFPGINDISIGVKVVNKGSTLRQVHAIEYNLILKEYNQVIDTGFVTNIGNSTLRPGESAILVTSISASVLPRGAKVQDLEVIFLASPLDE